MDLKTEYLTGNVFEIIKRGEKCILHYDIFSQISLEDDFIPKHNFTVSQAEMIMILKQWGKIVNATPTILEFYIVRDTQDKILFIESISKEIQNSNLINLNLKLLQNFFDYFQQFNPGLFDDFLYDANQNKAETGMHRLCKKNGNLIISLKSGADYSEIPISLFISTFNKFWEFNEQNNFPEKFNMLYTDEGKIEFYLD